MVQEGGNNKPAAKDEEWNQVVGQQIEKSMVVVVGQQGSSPGQVAPQGEAALEGIPPKDGVSGVTVGHWAGLITHSQVVKPAKT